MLQKDRANAIMCWPSRGQHRDIFLWVTGSTFVKIYNYPRMKIPEHSDITGEGAVGGGSGGRACTRPLDVQRRRGGLGRGQPCSMVSTSSPIPGEAVM